MRVSIAKRVNLVIFPLLILFAPALAFAEAEAAGPLKPGEADAIVARMAAAFDRLEAYQAEVETGIFRNGLRTETRRFCYSFQKPGRIRIDMKTPNPGMRMIYPDRKDRVLVRFGGWMGFLALRLAPDNDRIMPRPGQRFDQTDLGLLIANIGRSIGADRRGELLVSETGERVVFEVLAEDHFQSGVDTRYRFIIDPRVWLPVAVEERTPKGELTRTVRFRHLDTAPALSEDFFRTD